MDTPLTPPLLRAAYSQGFFPMPDPETGEILWFHPDPRAILPLEHFRCSRSLRRTMRRHPFQITIDQAFTEVMEGCAERTETWITDEFLSAYSKLHEEGGAHSVEVWLEGELVGGVYGVSLAGAFFAESKFYRVTDASKVALYHLVKHMKSRGMTLLEVQFLTEHLARLGAVEIPRETYLRFLMEALEQRVSF